MQNSTLKTAVITGATQGIGKAIAEKLLSEGFSITICARSVEDLEQRKREWLAKFPTATIHIVSADFSKPEEVTAFAEKCLELNKSVDILVNNAGIFQPGELATEPEGQLESLLQVNLLSAYHLTRAILPAMKEKLSGHIFNICSVASLSAYPNGGAYSITKYALLGFSDNLRYELSNFKIKVTAISPGPTMSRSWEGADVSGDKLMEATDIAEVLWNAYKLSPQANVEHIVLKPLTSML